MSDIAKWGDLIAEAISGIYGDRPTDPDEPFNLCHEAWAQYDELRAERDRLREALERISNAEEYHGHGLTVRDIARAALAKEAGQ